MSEKCFYHSLSYICVISGEIVILLFNHGSNHFINIGTKKRGIFMYDKQFIDKEEIVEFILSDVRNKFERFIALVQILRTAELSPILVMF